MKNYVLNLTWLGVEELISVAEINSLITYLNCTVIILESNSAPLARRLWVGVAPTSVPPSPYYSVNTCISGLDTI